MTLMTYESMMQVIISGGSWDVKQTGALIRPLLKSFSFSRSPFQSSIPRPGFKNDRKIESMKLVTYSVYHHPAPLRKGKLKLSSIFPDFR